MASDGIYFIPKADAEGHYSVQFYDFATGKSSQVFPMHGGVSNGLAVSPDGRTLLFAQKDEVRSDLMLVRNFR